MVFPSREFHAPPVDLRPDHGRRPDPPHALERARLAQVLRWQSWEDESCPLGGVLFIPSLRQES